MGFRNRVDDEIARRQFVGVPLEVLEHVRGLSNTDADLLGTPIVTWKGTYTVCNCNYPSDQDGLTCSKCTGKINF